MNALAEKLKTAGVDTLGARLTTACTQAIRKHPHNVASAWMEVGAIFGCDLIRQLMADMQGKEPKPSKAFKKIEAGLNDALEIARSAPVPYKPRVSPLKRLEESGQLHRLRQVVSKYKNSGDMPWSDVGWHELNGLKRDGKEAIALLEAGPANVPNDGRTVGDVLGIKRTDEIIAAVRNLK